jgi:hypothetical protein
MAEQKIEPPNSTVDDWFGQNVARDEETADQAVAEAGGDMDKAEQIFEERAEGEATYKEGHQRPDDGHQGTA